MGSGKTTALLQVVHNYREKDYEVILCKPQLDTKGANSVVSRLGVEREVDYSIDKDFSFLELLQVFQIDAIVVDEAQFLTTVQVDELFIISKKYNIPVLAYGLRCDFLMEGFEGSTRLLEIADEIKELKNICKCGKKATQNLRLLNGNPIFDGEQIAIDDGSEYSYEGVCGECYLRKRKILK